jgi:hypothetical protein
MNCSFGRQLDSPRLRGVMRLDEVRHVESLPLLGTGKNDYKVLRGRLIREAPGVLTAAMKNVSP